MTARTLTEIRQDTAVLLARDPDHGGASTPDPMSRRFQQHAAIVEHRSSPGQRRARRVRRRIAGESRRRNRGAA